MKPKLTLKCSNKQCERFDQRMVLDEDPRDSSYYWCQSCHTQCSIEIEHGEEKFGNMESFGSYLSGLVQEYIGLKKLIERRVAEEDEQARHDEIRAFLVDVKCTCCRQPLMDADGIPSSMSAEKSSNRRLTSR
jgi:hypothetical protein